MTRNLRFVMLVIAAVAMAGFALTLHSQVRGQAPAAPTPGQPPQEPRGGQRGGGGPGTEEGIAQFERRCSICHNNPVLDLTPSANAIREMTPERILQSVTTGSMRAYVEGLGEPQVRRIAEFMAGRPLGSSKTGDAKNMPNKCAANPAMGNPASSPGWNGWGLDASNTRLQPAASAGLTAAQAPRLKVKWAFAFPSGESSNSQPSVVA